MQSPSAFLFLAGLVATGRLSVNKRFPGWFHPKPTPEFPFNKNFSQFEAAIPLKPEFRFAHEPLQAEANGRFIGRQSEMEALAERILFSEGGSFLITGYRGVGKTSFIIQVLKKLEDALPWAETFLGETQILDVHLNLARPLKPAELMHHIIRRLYDRLRETGLYPLLSTELKDALTLAHHRTSVNMTRKLAESSERSFGFDEASFEAVNLKARIKAPFSFKRSRSQNYEASFLGYDDKAAEHDIMHISKQLSAGYVKRPTWLLRIKNALWGIPQSRAKLKIVFVFDELDKLEEINALAESNKSMTEAVSKDAVEPPSRPVIDEMLSSLKNLFTTSHISFVFVAGKDLQERWLEDLGKGDSIYESVFSYDKYLGCMWVDMGQICDEMVDWQILPRTDATAPLGRINCGKCGKQNLVGNRYCRFCGRSLRVTVGLPEPSKRPQQIQPEKHQARPAGATFPFDAGGNEDERCAKCRATISKESMFCGTCDAYILDSNHARSVFGDFKQYLYYKGRGIPRRIIRGFNEYVQWHGKRPVLVFTRSDIRRIRFYANLQGVLEKQEPRLFGHISEEICGTQQDKRRLGVYYLVDWMLRQGEMDFTLKDAISASKRLSAKIAPAAEVAPRIIADIIDVLLKDDYLMVVQKEINQVQIADVDARSDNRYRLTPRRLAEMGGLSDAFEEESYALSTREIDISKVGNYKLLELIGQGGMATVHRAWDEHQNRLVAVKLLLTNLASNAQAIDRFKREAEVMRGLRHPNIVQYYDMGVDEGRFYIAMEYLDGVSLRTVLRTHGKLDLNLVISIAKPLADALNYLHGQDLVRNDVKPDNIMLNTTGRVYLIDFSITKHVEETDRITQTGILVGTPHYMAPEQASPAREDARADIYSFGVVLYEMLTGKLPIEAGESPVAIVMASASEIPIPPSQHIELPKQVESIILRCLEKAPEKRFQSLVDVMSALLKAMDDQQIVDLGPLVMSTLEESRSAQEINNEATHRLKSLSLLRPAKNAESVAPAAPITEVVKIETGPQVRVLNGPSDVGRQHILRPGKTSIGRSSENDIVLVSPKISRFHSMVICKADGCRIEDLNSNNGTLINEVMIRGDYLLHHGDRIQMGDYLLEFG